tara:strand:+ start:20299 stop:21237 length:939 start_codon:yes stop_codon:yes gene_type:complete
MRLLLYLLILISPLLVSGQDFDFFLPASQQVIFGTYDADAQAFIDAVGTLTESQEIAVDNLVKGLKANGLWSKLDVVYPIIGGTAAAHKWNLKDPRDSDDAFRLVFSSSGSGSWIHDANGMENVSTATTDAAIAVTYYHLSDLGAETSDFNCSISFYQNKDYSLMSRPRAIVAMTGYNGGDNFHFGVRNTGTMNFYLGQNSGSTSYSGDGRQFSTMATQSDGNVSMYKNGVIVGTVTTPARNLNFLNDRPLAFGSLMNGSAPYDISDCLSSYHSSARYAFVSVGKEDLTATEAANLNNVVEVYQDALGRGVN